MFNVLTAQPNNNMKLWQLLAIAHNDLKIQERAKGCVIDMGNWVVKKKQLKLNGEDVDYVSAENLNEDDEVTTESVCTVCLAGSVLYRRLPENKHDEIFDWMCAINYLREFDVNSALNSLYRSEINEIPYHLSGDYDTDKKEWWKEQKKLLKWLQDRDL